MTREDAYYELINTLECALYYGEHRPFADQSARETRAKRTEKHIQRALNLARSLRDGTEGELAA